MPIKENAMIETCCEPRGSASAAAKPLSDPSSQRSQKLAAVGGIVGALAASSCCILPLALFSVGVSGAWIGNLTRLAPYQPYFLTATMASLGYGYWLVYRSRRMVCADGQACARPLPNRLVMSGLILATLLVASALGVDFLAPLFFNL